MVLASSAHALQASIPEVEVQVPVVDGQEPATICYREWVSTSIDTVTDTDTFRFYAVAGEQLHLSLRSVNGMDPFVQVFGPNGQVFTPFSCGHVCTIDADFAELVQHTGIHVMLVSDSGSDESGPYVFSLERSEPNVPVPAIDYGTTYSIPFEYVTDHGFATFEGEAGSMITIA